MSFLEGQKEGMVSITGLLKRLWPLQSANSVSHMEIATAISHIFTNSLSPVQTGALLTALHFTDLDRQPQVLAACASVMLDSAAVIDRKEIKQALGKRKRRQGSYRGGLCDIVGTGGDSHNTFNVSTTASIICSSLLAIGKHGNRASTSKSGSADILKCCKPVAPILEAVKPETIAKVYAETNYAFLFAPVFHPGMRHVATVRRELGWRTIFNLLGPLSNPVESTNGLSPSHRKPSPSLLEARVVGVARRELGPAFAEALVANGSRKAIVVCGAEELDEVSCAGPTYCWMLKEKPNPAYHARYGSQPSAEDDLDADDYTTSDDEAPSRTTVEIEHFQLTPEDFGLSRHPLSEVAPGRGPEENAETLMALMDNRLPRDLEPVLDFVLLNAAALFVASGICEANISSMGDGDDGKVVKERGPGGGRWREGVRRARWAIESGATRREWESFVEVTNSLEA